MKQIYTYLKAAYFWIFFICWTFLLFSLLCFFRIFFLFGKIPGFDHLAHWVACFWGKCVLLFTPGWRVTIEGKQNLPPKNKACVYVANHQSNADIWIICSLMRPLRFLSKIEAFDLPFIGRAMNWAGYIPLRRGDKGSHTKALNDSAIWLRKNVPMVFFPEGTRSETDELRPFKAGAFLLSIEEDVPIVPIALNGTTTFLKKGTAIPGSAHVRVSILPTIRPTPGEEAQNFASRVRTIISDEIKRLRSDKF